ncbi:acyltransferase [Bacillus shivajii]|uniref:acyltransferase n=1 Tax=Bacillus shivajii TaxID=1983719 RepID=UPI001CFB8FFA|nr:acyltransferase [Bacillus shivajii]UCZ52963.1 acyltransferase [Bacillus shivajii]
MSFNLVLDAILGERITFYEVECLACGFNEVYYADPHTNKQIGRACQHCDSIQVFDRNLEKKQMVQLDGLP